MSNVETNTTQQVNPDNTALNKDHNHSDVELLYKIYIDKRLKSQSDFYKSRVRENQSNANFTFTFSTAIMSISAFVATVSAVVSSPIFSLLSAILPAFAALLAAFRQLYGWERQISIYQDALMGLERVKLLTLDKDQPLDNLPAIYTDLVVGGEEIFTGEVNQWGQFVQNTDKTAQEDTTDTRVTSALMADLRLSDEQIDTIRKIMAAGNPKAAFSNQQTITVHPEETTALPAGANDAQANPSSASAPISVTTTRTDTTTFHPEDTSNVAGQGGSVVDAQAFQPAAVAPISVTTTHTESTVVEHVIPAVETSAPAEEESPVMETQAEAVTEQEPAPEGMDALTPGSAHVDAPQASEEIDALMSHQDATNEPPPPEALSSLAPGSMHVDAPQAPPENPNPEQDPNANG